MLGIYMWLQARMDTLRAARERGAAAVEYGLLVALIAVAIIGTVALLGEQLRDFFEAVVQALEPYVPGGSS